MREWVVFHYELYKRGLVTKAKALVLVEISQCKCVEETWRISYSLTGPFLYFGQTKEKYGKECKVREQTALCYIVFIII